MCSEIGFSNIFILLILILINFFGQIYVIASLTNDFLINILISVCQAQNPLDPTECNLGYSQFGFNGVLIFIGVNLLFLIFSTAIYHHLNCNLNQIIPDKLSSQLIIPVHTPLRLDQVAKTNGDKTPASIFIHYTQSWVKEDPIIE